MIVITIFLLISSHLKTANSARVLLIGESTENPLVNLFKEVQNLNVDTEFINHEIEEELQQNNSFCSMINSKNFAAIVDFSWGGWESAKQISKEIKIPYIRVEVSSRE